MLSHVSVVATAKLAFGYLVSHIYFELLKSMFIVFLIYKVFPWQQLAGA